MPSVASLKIAINQQLSDAENKRLIAEKLMRSADEHAERGDEVKAKLDRDSAERYLRDLEGIEKTIAEYEADIEKREQKAAEIDKRMAELRQRFEHDFKGLESEKESVVAALMFRDDNVVAAQRAAKDKKLNDKEQELQKNFEHELDRLEREKQFILG